MSESRFERTEMLLGQAAIEKLRGSHVAVFGLGGVGGACVEALARAGVGHLTLIDPDTVSVSNINRQLFALDSTVGRLKTDVAKERIFDINKDARVSTHPAFYMPDTEGIWDDFDYVVDAIDTVTAKIDLAVRAQEKNIPIISAMGAGNKLCPEKFEVADIYKTSICPLCRVMRRELSKRGVGGLKVVYSKEQPIKPEQKAEGARTPGSVSFVPPVVGYILAAEVIKDILGI